MKRKEKSTIVKRGRQYNGQHHSLPIERTHKLWLEEQAGRIAYRLAGASRKKVRTEIVVGLRMRGVALDAANAQADRAIAYLDARIAQLRQVRSLSPFAPIAVAG